MKIFLSFLQSAKKHAIPAYDFWLFYIKNGISEAGHQYTECPDVDWALGLVPQSKASHAAWKEQAWTKTIAWLKKHPADLFLSYLYPEQIDTAAVRRIREMGIPCVNFFCDNVRQFTKAPAEFGVFDLNWVPEYKAVDFYKKAGYAYINLPMPIWVDPELRSLPTESNQQITFIGSKDLQRKLLFENILQLNPGIPLAIYGNGWDGNTAQQTVAPVTYTFYNKLLHQYNFVMNNGIVPYLRKLKQRHISTAASQVLKSKLHGTIDFKTYNKLTAESMITLGINRYPSFNYPLDKPNTYSRLRDIEAPMLGACYLTEWTSGIEQLYEIGREIEVYRNAEDFMEKIKELQADKHKRTALRKNGQKKAANEHTIPRSLGKILQKLN